MTQSENTTRTRRAQTLVDLVEKVQGGYRVRSARDPDVAYFVSKPNGQIICTCPDFEKHFAEDPRWECKPILAAWEAHRLGKLNRDARDLSDGQAGRAPEATTTEDPSVTGIQEEEITPLESCGRCGRTFPADELVPTNGADGSSLLCWECLETSATTTEEPPFTYPAGKADAETIPAQSPCGRCGKFFPLAQLEGEVCLKCLTQVNSPPLADIYQVLTRPFPPSMVELKPGAVTQDKTRALALAYVDMRTYQARLDEVVGPDRWEVEYRTLGDRAVICRLTLLGVTREDVGEADAEDANAWTSAVAQAFKRACAGFGLGRFLYSLPRVWAAYSAEKKAIVNPAEVVRKMYQQAGIS